MSSNLSKPIKGRSEGSSLRLFHSAFGRRGSSRGRPPSHAELSVVVHPKHFSTAGSNTYIGGEVREFGEGMRRGHREIAAIGQSGLGLKANADDIEGGNLA